MGRKKSEEKKFRLCVYLIKEDCIQQEDVLKDASLLTKYTIKGVSANNTALFVKESHSNPPKWAVFFSGALEKNLADLYNSSSAAALIVKHNKQFFAYTFGHGHHLLNPNNIVDSFGLKVVLNSIDAAKIRSVDIKNLDTVLRYSKVQTSQAGSVDNFGMNIDRDILNAVTGLSNDEALGKQISGSTALHLSLAVKVQNLPDLCGKLLTKFNDKNYKETFPWVDHISEVRNPHLIGELNDSLVNAVKEKDFERFFLAPPEIVDWELVEGFKYKTSDEEVREDIHISDVMPNDNTEEVSLAWLKKKEVLCIGKDSEQIIDGWTLYDCINYELKKDRETYLLTGSKWFKIDSHYVDTVNKEIGVISEYKNFTFPKYGGEREDEYNKSVADKNSKTCFLMDKKNIAYGGGMSKIEFCDLLINKTDFVHVKRFRGSSALSHLFLQGFNSAFLFLTDSDFSKKVNKLLPTQWKFSEGDNIKASDYEVVFAVISRAKGSTKDIFPFFSKVSLIHIYKQLKAYGYKVSIAKIETNTTAQKGRE